MTAQNNERTGSHMNSNAASAARFRLAVTLKEFYVNKIQILISVVISLLLLLLKNLSPSFLSVFYTSAAFDAKKNN